MVGLPVHSGSDATHRPAWLVVPHGRTSPPPLRPHGPPPWRTITSRPWRGRVEGGASSRGSGGLGVGRCLALPSAAARLAGGMEVG